MKTRYKNPAIHQAFRVLETLSADEETRQRAELREKALRNAISELEAAKDEGIEQGREQGRQEGELIGAICALQRVLRRSISSREELTQKSLQELKIMLSELEADLN